MNTKTTTARSSATLDLAVLESMTSQPTSRLVSIAALLLVAFIACAISAQAQTEKDSDDVIRVATSEIKVVASIADEQGIPRAARADELEVYADGELQPITGTGAARPTDVILVVDISKSMADRLQFVREIVDKFAASSDQANTYRLLLFNEQVKDAGVFEGTPAGRKQLLKTLDRVKAAGNTAFFRTLSELPRYTGTFGELTNRKVVAVFSDLKSNAPEESFFEGVATSLDTIGASIQIVGLGWTKFYASSNIAGYAPNETSTAIARKISSRYAVHLLAEPRNAKSIAADLSRNVETTVQLSFQPTERAAAAGKHMVRVTVRQRPEWTVKARQSYEISAIGVNQ